ncbi:MAG: calcium/sodium antiporter [Pseudomonadota bacterium]
MTDLLLLLAGFVLLIVGGEFLVRGAVNVAESMGMSKLLIGITLVGFGTSSPELVTSLQASFAGSPGIAIGNFVGSSISNILLIIGVSAVLFPLAVSRHSLQRDGAAVLVSALAFTAVGFFFPFNQLVGGLFVTALIGYLVLAYRDEMRLTRAANNAVDHTAPIERGMAHDEVLPGLDEGLRNNLPLAFAMAIGGLITIVIGGRLLVDGAVGIARTYQVSETVIGLTIVAVGTSMPELVTSVIAALKKHSDVAVGNILGSNIYNIFGIGGVVGLIAPTDIPAQIITFDNIVMVAATVALIAFAWTSKRVGRIEGGILLGAYIAYIYALWPHNIAA